ncbi:MAG: hypothetical protein H0X25_14785 [Acidobacteriales bacterium]|nr:hypothetical protein [Terriglobales bacterium]
MSTTSKALQQLSAAMQRSRVVLEAGTHSPWGSRLLSRLGQEVIVADASNVRLIGESRKKDDRLDARTLARLARIDPQLLSPVQHRSGSGSQLCHHVWVCPSIPFASRPSERAIIHSQRVALCDNFDGSERRVIWRVICWPTVVLKFVLLCSVLERLCCFSPFRRRWCMGSIRSPRGLPPGSMRLVGPLS